MSGNSASSGNWVDFPPVNYPGGYCPSRNLQATRASGPASAYPSVPPVRPAPPIPPTPLVRPTPPVPPAPPAPSFDIKFGWSGDVDYSQDSDMRRSLEGKIREALKEYSKGIFHIL